MTIGIIGYEPVQIVGNCSDIFRNRPFVVIQDYDEPFGVERVLKAVPGVAATTVQLSPGLAEVSFDPARTGVPALRAAVEAAGYDIAA